MADTPFQSLSPEDRRDALEVAAGRSGRRAHLLEKDVWVVHTLRSLTESPFGRDLTFKGGTSLAKAYRAIRRFSEDLDITYDIRAIAPDLVERHGEDALPSTRKQVQKWTREIRKRLAEWVESRAHSTIEANLAESGLSARVRIDGDRLFVGYEPLISDYGFVRPEVTVEFGARSTGEPRQECPIECDAAPYIPEIAFPSVRTLVMLAERTFLGEGDCCPCILPPTARPGRASFPALARSRSPRRRRLRRTGARQPKPSAVCSTTQGDVLSGEGRRTGMDRLQGRRIWRVATGAPWSWL